jgi:hypothetical protein
VTLDEIAALDRHRYLSLATFRRSGAEVRTPVWFAAAGGRLWVMTGGDSGKGCSTWSRGSGGASSTARGSPSTSSAPRAWSGGDIYSCQPRARGDDAMATTAAITNASVPVTDYARLDERILARDQVGASQVLYALLRQGRPAIEIVRETVRIHAP